MSNETVLKMVGIDKRFGGIHALNNVSFDVRRGEVHVLMGENGAGKSTLIKVLAGLYQAEEGEIFIDDKKVEIKSPIAARELGISVIHQELSMCANMTIAENIYRNEEPRRGVFRFVDFGKMYRDAQATLDHMHMKLRSDMKVETLSVAQQQMVEIAGALSKNAQIIVMDEPTASLTETEIRALFETVAELKARKVGIIYISHRMDETFEIGDRVTVLRDGQTVGTKDVKDTNMDEVIEMMVGRPLTEVYKGERAVGGEVVLETKGFTNERLKNVSIQVRKGEILGFSGLVGAGRTELAKAIFGLDPLESGELYLYGKKVKIRNAQDAIDNGLGMVPEDRKGAGLVLMHSIGNNLTLAVLKKFIKGINVNKRKENEIINDYKDKLSIKMTGPDQVAGDLSGGNQQKVVVSKWLATEPQILIMDEPTRGIDVGAKAEIYALMRKLASEGVTIMFISSDLPEIINMSSRVVVMREGEVSGILDGNKEELTQVKIMRLAQGGYKNADNN
nr:sugar ABC transporter ATP-binding protein [Maliibacterium massiliense]